MRKTPSLPSLPGPLWPGVVALDRVLSMSQIEINCGLMLNWIVWNKTMYIWEKMDKPLIIKLQNILNSISHTKKVIFYWIPSQKGIQGNHIGIQGNHKTDLITKSTLDMVLDKNSKIPYIDLKPKISQILAQKW